MNLFFLTFSLLLSFSPVKKVNQISTISDFSIYKTTYSIGGTNQIGSQMISKYFENEVEVFKENDLYFLSLTLLDNQALSDLNISVSTLKSGILEEINGKQTTYTITLSEEDIQKDIAISGNVAKMAKQVSFTLKADIDNLTNTNEKVSEEKEYPARFVPELQFDFNGEVETTLNSYYKLPEANATFDNQNIPVNINVASPNGNEVEIDENNRIQVNELGTYSIDYFASTSLYKTNLGNDSFVKETINLICNSSINSMVKIVDINNILPKDYVIQCQRIESGINFDKIADLLSGKSENFEVTNISLLNSNGEDINLNDNIEFRVVTNPNYDRNKVKVYYYNEDNLELVSSKGYGRYVSFENSKVGIYVILIEGVKEAFNLPLIITLSIIGLVVIIALIVSVVIWILKKKHKKII